MPTFTTFIRQTCNVGTTHICAVEADDIEEAKRLGIEQCVHDWNSDSTDYDDPVYTADNLTVIGVAEGDVNILEWNDNL